LIKIWSVISSFDYVSAYSRIHPRHGRLHPGPTRAAACYSAEWPSACVNECALVILVSLLLFGLEKAHTDVTPKLARQVARATS